MKRTLYKTFLIALLFLLAACSKGPRPDDVATGRSVFEAKGCSACHTVERPKGKESVADILQKKGPDLWYAGSKFRDGFIKTWLREPRQIRPLAYNTHNDDNDGSHPVLEKGEARRVAAFLTTLRSPAVKSSGIEPTYNRLGRERFSVTFSCYVCHRSEGASSGVGGVSGPDLTGASKRLNPDWVYAFLTNPKAFASKSPMPVYKGLTGNADMKALAEYVSSF